MSEIKHDRDCVLPSDGRAEGLVKASEFFALAAERDALRAEVERLRTENIQMQAALGYGILAEDERHIIPSNPFKCGTCDAKDAEVTRLRAEVERLNKSRNKWGQKYNKLLEKHKVTLSQLKTAVWSDSEECKLLAADNERLRAALDKMQRSRDRYRQAWEAEKARAALSDIQPAPSYTEGHCAHKKAPGGCQLHNLQCGYPDCDRLPLPPPPEKGEW